MTIFNSVFSRNFHSSAVVVVSNALITTPASFPPITSQRVMSAASALLAAFCVAMLWASSVLAQERTASARRETEITAQSTAAERKLANLPQDNLSLLIFGDQQTLAVSIDAAVHETSRAPSRDSHGYLVLPETRLRRDIAHTAGRIWEREQAEQRAEEQRQRDNARALVASSSPGTGQFQTASAHAQSIAHVMCETYKVVVYRAIELGQQGILLDIALSMVDREWERQPRLAEFLTWSIGQAYRDPQATAEALNSGRWRELCANYLMGRW